MAERSRILLVTRNLPPLVGGMERLNWHMARELSKYGDVCVIGPIGAAALAPKGVRVIEVPLRPLWRFLAAALWQSVRFARRWRPDVILAGSGLTALPVLLAARLAEARAAAYVHGLDLVVPHPVYRRLWIPALRRMNGIVVNSRATCAQAEALGISPSRMAIVHPGVQMPVGGSATDEADRFRAEHGLGDGPLLLSIGRLSARKGLLEFVQESLPRIVKASPATVLLIVGGAPSDALHSRAQDPKAIQEAAARAGIAASVRFLGQIGDEELGAAYRAASVHVFPVINIPGDPEGFGMVAVEAAAHGLPTAAFANGGVTDAVAEGVSGRLVKGGDYDALADAVVELLAHDRALAENCRTFAKRFEWSAFGRGVADALQIGDKACDLSHAGSARS